MGYRNLLLRLRAVAAVTLAAGLLTQTAMIQAQPFRLIERAACIREGESCAAQGAVCCAGLICAGRDAVCMIGSGAK